MRPLPPRPVRLHFFRPTALGDLLAARRARAGLSTVQLGRRAGVDGSYISRIESGERPHVERATLARIGAALGLDPSAIDALLIAGGYAPDWLRALDPEDSTVAAVGRALTDEAMTPGARADFRAVVETIAGRWVPAAAVAPAQRRAQGGN